MIPSLVMRLWSFLSPYCFICTGLERSSEWLITLGSSLYRGQETPKLSLLCKVARRHREAVVAASCAQLATAGQVFFLVRIVAPHPTPPQIRRGYPNSKITAIKRNSLSPPPNVAISSKWRTHSTTSRFAKAALLAMAGALRSPLRRPSTVSPMRLSQRVTS